MDRADTIPLDICVVGVGGSGCNTVGRLVESRGLHNLINNVKIIGLNTDAAALKSVSIPKKFVIGGRRTTKGLGAGARPLLGKVAAEESMFEILDEIGSPDLVILTCGLGGGTGTGALPTIANAIRSREEDMLILSMVTMPFTAEGMTRLASARLGFREIFDLSDITFVQFNDFLLQLAPKIPMSIAFKMMDRILSDMITRLVRLTETVGVINIDFADFRTATKDAGLGFVGLGHAPTVVEAAENAFDNRLLDLDLTEAKTLLLNITGSQNLRLEDAERVPSELMSKYSIENIILGVQLEDVPQPEVFVVAGGVHSKMLEDFCGTPFR